MPIAFWAFPIFEVFIGFGVVVEDVDSKITNGSFVAARFYSFVHFLFAVNWNFAEVVAAAVGAVFIENDFDFLAADRAGFIQPL